MVMNKYILILFACALFGRADTAVRDGPRLSTGAADWQWLDAAESRASRCDTMVLRSTFLYVLSRSFDAVRKLELELY